MNDIIDKTSRFHIFQRISMVVISIMIVLMIVERVSAEAYDKVEFKTNFASDLKMSSFKENYIDLSVNNDDPLLSFNYCFRIKFSSIIGQCLFKTKDFGFKFKTETYGFLLLHDAWILFEYGEKLVPLKWYHVCLSHDPGHLLLVMNDKPLINKHIQTKKQSNDPELILDDKLKIGFCDWDNYPETSITRGFLTDFNMWSKSFTMKDMLDFTLNCLPLSSKPDIITWDNIKKEVKGENVEISELEVTNLCETNSSQSINKTILVIPAKRSYDSTKDLCEALGGNFPMFRNEKDIESWNGKIPFKNRYDNGNDVMTDTCGNYFWVPIRQSDKKSDTGGGGYMWRDDISSAQQIKTYLPWQFSQPNGFEYQQCVAIELSTLEIVDQDCNAQICSLCEFYGSVNFHIRGLPDTSSIDDDYIFVPALQKADRLTFMGYKQYSIRWVYKNDVWEMLDRSNSVSATFDSSHLDFPIGRADWSLNNQSSLKSTDSRGSMQLKLTRVITNNNLILLLNVIKNDVVLPLLNNSS